jgi:uncharacterized Fe-S radical SAM superfamily protein PflX
MIKNYRFSVDLENNHHYILIDNVTGSSYYCPAEDDANTIASILNNQYDLLQEQNNKIREYEKLLDKKGVIIQSTKKICKNCRESSFVYMGDNDEVYCDLKNDKVKMNATCDNWEEE